MNGYAEKNLSNLCNTVKEWNDAVLAGELDDPIKPCPRENLIITEELLNHAKNLVTMITDVGLDIFPTQRGTVQIELEKKTLVNGEKKTLYMEAEIYSDKINYFEATVNPVRQLFQQDNFPAEEVAKRFNSMRD